MYQTRDQLNTVVRNPKNMPEGNYKKSHVRAWAGFARESGAIRKMMDGLSEYIDAYQDRFHSPVGEDGVMCEPVKELIDGLYQLLECETNGLDSRAVADGLCYLADTAKIDWHK